VQSAVADLFDFRAMGMVHVKGRSGGIDLWELVSANAR
jgi:adenylate cyclase